MMSAGEQQQQQQPPSPPPEDDPSALPLPYAHTLLRSFDSFLTVAVHNILYYRGIYPPRTFLSVRAFDLPVQQNRHPLVCAWVRDAVDAVSAQIADGAVDRVAVVLHAPPPPPPPKPATAAAAAAPAGAAKGAGARAAAAAAAGKPPAGPGPEPEARPAAAVGGASAKDSEKMPPPPRPVPRRQAAAAATAALLTSSKPQVPSSKLQLQLQLQRQRQRQTPAAAGSKAAAPKKPPPVLPPGAVLERWMFDVSLFPAWPGGAAAMRTFWQDRAAEAARKRRARREAMRNAGIEVDSDEDGDYDDSDVELLDEYESDEEDEDGEDEDEEDEDGEDEDGDEVMRDSPPYDSTNTDDGPVNWADVNQQLRGALARLANAGEKLGHLPPGCTFTIAVELRDEAPPPIRHPQPWIPSQPSLQPPTAKRPQNGRDLGGAKTTAVRSVEAGPLFFECWVEEGRAKDRLARTPPVVKTQPKPPIRGKGK